MISARSEIFCVIGNPVKHSRSPLVHNFLFRKMGIDAVYVAFEVKSLKTFFEFARDVGIKGISITIPHKVEAMKFVDRVDEVSLRVGAINTVKNRDGVLEGYNTDVEGVVRSFESRGVKDLCGKTALIVGSGGVARSCILAFAKMNISRLVISGRTEEKVRRLVNDVKSFFEKTEGIDLKSVDKVIDEVDVIANCTPVGMLPNVEESPIDVSLLKSKHIVFDTIYTPIETKLIRCAKEKNCLVIYGIDMFVFQALEQERIWLDRRDIYYFKEELITLLTQIH
ncbi:MAG: shikimate dehydrogenase [Brevinematia bacterium]